MGHMRIGTLPMTAPWKDVVAKIGNGMNVSVVADATLDAARRAFLSIGKDAGFRETMYFLIELALAGGKPDPAVALADLGIIIPDSTSLAEIIVVVSAELDRRIDATRRRSDFGEMAQQALVSALLEHMQKHLSGLFQPSRAEAVAALGELRKMNVFGAVTRRFCAKLTNAALSYFLSRTLATHVGEGQRFATTNQVSEFERALTAHCDESSAIMEQFAAEWFSKRRFVDGGKISRESAERFSWFGMQKMRLELEERARKK